MTEKYLNMAIEKSQNKSKSKKMKQLKLTTIALLIIFSFSCDKKTENDVVFDANFAGGKLDSIASQGNDKYTAYIKPAFEPVNKSQYFAFTVASKSEKTIDVTLDYEDYKHRYIPKLSTDRKTWKPIEDANIQIDTTLGIATLKLNVSPKKLYVAAQEIESSEDTYNWLDGILKKHPYLKKRVAGKTVKNKDNFVVTSNDSLNKAIVLVARQHPPETPGGTIGFKAFYKTLLNNTETAEKFRDNYNIVTFPLVNPDGADMGNWRHNANGKDLNRDWVDFTQPETQTVKNYVKSLKENNINIEFALDFHTSHSGPYLLILDSINEAKTNKIIPDWINNIESKSQFKVEARRRSQELPYCYNYFYNQIGCEAVTYEDGDEINRDTIRKRARVYARELMDVLLTTNLN